MEVAGCDCTASYIKTVAKLLHTPSQARSYEYTAWASDKHVKRCQDP